MSAPTADLGPLIRLWGVSTSQLPDAKATPGELAPFLISILQEAVPFVDSVAPKASAAAPAAAAAAATAAEPFSTLGHPTQAWKAKGSKTFADSAAKVDLLERVVAAADLETIAARHSASSVLPNSPSKMGPETWVCRRSVHRDAAAKGTASWAEFRGCIKDRHAETEDAFTPSITGAREAMAWDCRGVEAVEGGEAWADFTLKVEEMKHRIGRPLRDRTFSVLQMTCAVVGGAAAAAEALAAPAVGAEKREFLVVSITVADFKSAPQAELSRQKGVVVAAYASVERVRELPRPSEAGGADIEWIMATASDARGVLPMWLQTRAVPGQIAKDVPMFLAWIARERAGEKHPEKGGVAVAAAAAAAPRTNGEAKLQAPLVPEKANGGTEAALPLLPHPPPPPVPKAEEAAAAAAAAVSVETPAAPAAEARTKGHAEKKGKQPALEERPVSVIVPLMPEAAVTMPLTVPGDAL